MRSMASMNRLQKIQNRFREYRMSMRTKLNLGLGSIAAMLLLSSIISILEYRRMSNYVTDLVADNIRNINVAQKLVSMSDEYNLKVLATIGEEDSISVSVPEFDRQAFMAQCDGLRTSISSKEAFPLADSVIYAYSAYMLTSLELPRVMASDFINSRDWFFNRLQPRYNRLRADIERLTDAAYSDLQTNSLTFQDSFYRSIIPGIVSVGAGLVLVLLLMFFIRSYYVSPVYRMLAALEDFTLRNQKYMCSFDGNDQMAALNSQITEVTEETVELRRRVKSLRDERERLIEAVQSVQE